MKYFSLAVLLTMTVAIVIAAIALAMWPGRTARARAHPYAEAVNVAGWVGLLAGGVLWPMALIWAYATRVEAGDDGAVGGVDQNGASEA